MLITGGESIINKITPLAIRVRGGDEKRYWSYAQDGLFVSKVDFYRFKDNHTKVRLFLSDESPAQVGLGTQDHLQAKSVWVIQPTGASSDDNLPPGFEGSHPADLLKNKLSQIPLPKWIGPPKFVFDIRWQVVAGEESKEVELQNQREMGILEAIYPRPSAIPSNPTALDLESSSRNELNIPFIPMSPFEDEDSTMGEASTCSMPQIPTSAISQMSQCSTANGNIPVNMIDQDLLMKVLSDPKWHERLIANHGTITNVNHVPSPSLPSVFSPEPPHALPLSSMTSPLKDVSYYKNLIQQHGEEKPEGVSQLNDQHNLNQELANSINSSKTKPCFYFNSSQGCRNGSNCPYEHDAYDVQSAKRVKLDSQSTGE